MAPDKNLKGNPLSGMTTKQKATAGALVVVVIIVLWNVIGLFGGGGEAPAPAPQPKAGPMSAATPGKLGAPTPASGGITPVPNPAAAGGPPTPALPQAPIAEGPALRETAASLDARIVDLQKQTQQKYMEEINQLQTLRIQREIAETNQAIAAANLATRTSEKAVSDLLTKPVPLPPAPVPLGAYSNQLVNPTLQGVNVAGVPTTGPATPPPGAATTPGPTNPPAPVETQYVVISVSMQLGRWSAVLGYQGRLFNVSIGDVLPVDGSVVSSINKNGVVLVKGNNRRRISIISSI